LPDFSIPAHCIAFRPIKPHSFGSFWQSVAIYLILVGIMGLGVLSLGSLHVVVAILALVAGIFILGSTLGHEPKKRNVQPLETFSRSLLN